ncbi:MAG: leucyl aminopeptidase family protein [Solirubrobacteraceae bacterium]|nr:leucyl aminopeptidase family protein [Solirubrobacteraceae bacterium]
MDVSSTTTAPSSTGADTIVVALFEGEAPAFDIDGALGALVDSGEAKPAYKKLALARAGGTRLLGVGLGARTDLDAERARVAAAVAHGRAAELGASTVCWVSPAAEVSGALVEGTVLASYRFDAFRSKPPEDAAGVTSLIVAGEMSETAVTEAAIVATAVNHARDLQNTPANEMTPTALAETALSLRDLDGVTVKIETCGGIEAHGMGCFAGVARGSEQEPALITIEYAPGGATGPKLGFVGKAVTFDSGGISLKPAGKMHEMKFDMSGGAAVLAATEAIIRLGLPVRLVSVIGATENLPSGRSVKPGDVLRAMDGTTVEVNNTDAEGRLVLADCLLWARECGAERIVDLATLTGAIVVGLGSTYAGLMGTDDDWVEAVRDAGDRTGELMWRLPLHPEYADMVKGTVADLVNATEVRKAGSITAAEFLKRFAGDVPWAHVDIAGTAWGLGRAYARKGGAGFGVRMLVDLARAHAA